MTMIKTHAMVQAQLDAEAAHVQGLLADEHAADVQMRAAIAAGDPHDEAVRAEIRANPAYDALHVARALKGF